MFLVVFLKTTVVLLYLRVVLVRNTAASYVRELHIFL